MRIVIIIFDTSPPPVMALGHSWWGGMKMLIRWMSLGLLAMVVCGSASAQLATSSTHQLETLAISGGGGFAASASHQMWYTVGQSTPPATMSSASNIIQGGLIPTLYPRTLIGDSNSDGVRDSADVVTTVEIKNGNQPVPTDIVEFFNADANTDGQINSADVDATADLINNP